MSHDANQPGQTGQRDALRDELREQMIELRLGRLSADEQVEAAARIAADAKLVAEDADLRDALGALNRYQVAMPNDLVERTIARIRKLHTVAVAPHKQSTPRVVWPEEQSGRVIRLHSFREITAVAATIILAVGIGVPSLVNMRDRAQRTACSWNLGQVGRGLQGYATAHADSLPFVGFSQANSWQPSRDPLIVRVPNRQHVFPLISSGQASADWFICPSGNDVPMAADQILSQRGFIEPRNISYATQNMAGVRPSLSGSPRLVVAGDDNPFFEDGVPAFDLAARKIGLSDPAAQNSKAHRRFGQNLLQADGLVRWSTTPASGVDGDNVWTLSGTQRYTGREGPLTNTDSHLLK